MKKTTMLLVLVVVGLLFVGGCAATGEATAPSGYYSGGGCGRLASDSANCNAFNSNQPTTNSVYLN